MNIPDDIKNILNKPGSDWSDSERKRLAEWLCQEYLGYLLSIATRRLGSPEAAKDVVQDILLEISSRGFCSYDPAKGIFRAYLVTAVKNKCLNVLRRKHNKVSPDDETIQIELEDTGSSPEDQAYLSEIVKAVNLLPDMNKSVLVLSAFKGYSDEEIAGILSITPGTARKRLSRARKMMRDLLL
jgi:RNA polymerase sigma-70 factor (ECF subfamily)